MTTYTSSLRLSNQVTGQNANTWGDIADDNFEFIDDAITGMVCCDMTGGSSKTLTANNGADDEARNSHLYIHGIPSSANSVIIPAAQKHYSFRAAYASVSGGIRIRTAGGTGVSVKAIDAGIVYCDGLSVYEIAIDSVSALDPSSNLSDLVCVTSAQANLGLKPEGTYIKSSGTKLELVLTQILSAIWPVGSFYANRTDGTNPATLYGIGTWTSIGMGRVPVGVGTGVDDNGVSAVVTAQSCGGEYVHTMTTAEMPSHRHNNGVADDGGNHPFVYGTTTAGLPGSASHSIALTGSTIAIQGLTGSTGSGTSFNVRNPWFSMYMWTRTA